MRDAVGVNPLARWARRLFGPRGAGSLIAPDPSVFVTHPALREAGVTVTPETAVQVAAVYGCCRMIVDSIAPAPIVVDEVGEGGRRDERHDDPAAWTLNWGAPVHLAPDAPPGQAIEEALIWSALLQGDGYAEIQVDQAGRFFGLWPIEAVRVKPTRDEFGRFYYEVQQPWGGVVAVPAARMFHLRGPSLFGWVGDSTVYRAAKAIGLAQASQVYASTYFANGTIVSGILKHPGKIGPKAKESLSEDWRKKWGAGQRQRGNGGTFDAPSRESMERRNFENMHGVPILDEGWDFQAINHDAQKSQLVESRRFQIAEVARYFGVPLSLLADSEAWTNLGELYLGFYRNALRPWAERFDAEATRKLFPMRQPWREVRHDLSLLTMGTFKDLVASLNIAVKGGILSANEARATLGKSPKPGADDLRVESTMTTLDRMLEGPTSAPAPGSATEAPSEDDPAAPDEGGGGDPPAPPRRRASAAEAAVALDRHARRISARRAAMAKQAPAKLEANLAELRAASVKSLVAACGLDPSAENEMRAGKAADAVVEGEPPHLAAERLLGS